MPTADEIQPALVASDGYDAGKDGEGYEDPKDLHVEEQDEAGKARPSQTPLKCVDGSGWKVRMSMQSPPKPLQTTTDDLCARLIR